MSKRLLCVLCILLMCFSMLVGCGKTDKPDVDKDTNDKVSDKVDGVKDEANDKDEDKTSVQEDIPYILRLKAPVKIFKEAGYDNAYVQTIAENGSYTIVEEKKDNDNNVWGKLKSGIGWIDLSALEKEENNPSIMKAGIVDVKLEKEYYEVSAIYSQNPTKVIFIPNETVKDLYILTMIQDAQGYSIGESLCVVDELKPEKPLVAVLEFSGDFTTFGLSFKDSKGKLHQYLLSISGRNGELVFEPYKE